MSAAEDIATLLSSEATIADKLAVVERLTRQRLARLLGVQSETAIPPSFEDVVTNVTAARYARIGNEGVSSYGQDGLSISFPDDDFAAYMDEINSYRDGDDYTRPRHGRAVFI